MNVRDKFPKTVRLKTYLGSLILVSVILVSLVAYTYNVSSRESHSWLDVAIYPKGLVKAYVNDVITLSAIVRNGTSPFLFK